MRLRIVLGLLLFPFLLKAQNAITNQHLFDTIPFLPTHYQERVAIFQKEEMVTGKIIFLGNSITEGGNWQKLTGDKSVINRGIGGDITFGLLGRLDDVISRQPSRLFILIGINDIGKDIPETVIANNYRKMIDRIRKESPLTKIFIQSILPLNNTVKGFPQHYNKPDKVLAANYLLKGLAFSMHCTYVDLYPIFLDNKKRLAEKYTVDGLHLKPEGYEVWIQYLKAKKYL